MLESSVLSEADIANCLYIFNIHLKAQKKKEEKEMCSYISIIITSELNAFINADFKERELMPTCTKQLVNPADRI